MRCRTADEIASQIGISKREVERIRQKLIGEKLSQIGPMEHLLGFPQVIFGMHRTRVTQILREHGFLGMLETNTTRIHEPDWDKILRELIPGPKEQGGSKATTWKRYAGGVPLSHLGLGQVTKSCHLNRSCSLFLCA